MSTFCAMIDLLSWNVNGIRAAERKGLLDVIAAERAAGRGDIVCLQETKAHRVQLNDELAAPPGYHSFFAEAEKKGYSGVAVFSAQRPDDVRTLGAPEFDREGRTLIVDFPNLTVINGYFPNSQARGARLDYKLAYCDAVQAEADRIVAAGRNVVVCGDFNVAHTEIDLARPKQNEENPGYLPEEREWMSRFLAAGWHDTFRLFTSEPGHYSWWSYRAGARERNVGWRIDYHLVNARLVPAVVGAAIRADIHGSDHCPVTLSISEDQL